MNRSEKFKGMRLQLGLSQAKFGKLIGLSDYTIKNLEKDETKWANLQASTDEKITAFYERFENELKKRTEDIYKEEAIETIKESVIKEVNGNDDSTILAMLEFTYDGLKMSSTHDEFIANIAILKRILKKYDL